MDEQDDPIHLKNAKILRICSDYENSDWEKDEKTTNDLGLQNQNPIHCHCMCAEKQKHSNV